eukprot:418154_1
MRKKFQFRNKDKQGKRPRKFTLPKLPRIPSISFKRSFSKSKSRCVECNDKTKDDNELCTECAIAKQKRQHAHVQGLMNILSDERSDSGVMDTLASPSSPLYLPHSTDSKEEWMNSDLTAAKHKPSVVTPDVTCTWTQDRPKSKSRSRRSSLGFMLDAFNSSISPSSETLAFTRTFSERAPQPLLHEWHTVDEYMNSNTIYNTDIQFKWEQKRDDIMRCNPNEFLYVVSMVIDEMNQQIKNAKQCTKLLLYNKPLILGYLHFNRVDGMSFNGSKHQFISNIKGIVFNVDNADANDFLTAIQRHQYAHDLYQNINGFDLSSMFNEIPSHCTISFNPSLASYEWANPPLQTSVFSLISTLTQYQNSSLLSKEKGKVKMVSRLDDFTHRISSILCNNWMDRVKEKIWDHTLQNMENCSELNMFYVLDCILNRKIDSNVRSEILDFLRRKGVKFTKRPDDDGSTVDLHQVVNAARMHVKDLHRLLASINVYRITTFYIQTEVKWDVSVQSLNQCKLKDVLYIVIHLMYDPLFCELRAIQDQIVEHFVRHKMDGITVNTVNAKLFLNDWEKSIKSKHKTSLSELHHAIQGCNIQDMANVSVEKHNRTNSGWVVCTQWSKRTNFTNIKRVGYRCDGLIVVADIISRSDEQSDTNKIQLRLQNIGCDSRLSEPFWLNLPNDKVCKPTKNIIEQSHRDVFDKWIMILKIKHRRDSGFSANVFRDMAFVAQTRPQLVFTIKHSNYAVPLHDKTSNHLLYSVFASALAAKCRKTRCHGMPKLDCHCDASEFQMYTYCMIMAILDAKKAEEMLAIVKEKNYDKHKTATQLCNVLRADPDGFSFDEWVDKSELFAVKHILIKHNMKSPRSLSTESPRFAGFISDPALLDHTMLIPRAIQSMQRLQKSHPTQIARRHVQNSAYMDKYIKHIQDWLLYDFYNTICLHCGSVNKSIMINRVFHFSSTLQNCRTCGHSRYSNEFDDDIPKTNSKSLRWFCKHHTRTFKEEGINTKPLEKALEACVIHDPLQISTHKEKELIIFMESLLTEPYDALTYYLSRFLNDIQVLRIKITADYYFHECKERFVTVYQFMHNAGIHSRHINIFKDCWDRAFAFNVLNDIDEAKSNKNDLCVDSEYLRIFKTLTPSISSFATEFIQKFKEFSPTMNSNVCLKDLVQRFLDFKIDRTVVSVIDNEVELLSLLHNKWEHSYTMHPRDSECSITPQHDSLQSEMIKELGSTMIRIRYSKLERKAKKLIKQTEQLITAKPSISDGSVRPGARIQMKHIHAILLFVEIPELRSKLRTLLSDKGSVAVHARFHHLFELLFDAVYSFGDVLDSKQTMYYSIDKDILLDKYRATATIPIIGYNNPKAFNDTKNQWMAACQCDTHLHSLDITSLVDPDNTTPHQNLYLFAGVPEIQIHKEIHIDRQTLRQGSKCKIYSHSNHRWFDGNVTDHFVDDEGEWLNVAYGPDLYGDGTGYMNKQVGRLSEDLSLVMYDTWDDLLQCFRGDTDMNRIKAFNDSLLKRVIHFLDGYGVVCGPELRFRIKTLLAYYKKSLNIIPDVDLFMKETKIDITHVPMDKHGCFRDEMKKKIVNRPWVALSDNTLADKSHERYDAGIFMRYDVNNPRFESLAEEMMFNDEVVTIYNERFDEYIAKAKEIHAEKCFVLSSNGDDFNFGIEKYQPISISHILAIIIHTKEPNYWREFTRSCLLLKHTDSDMVVQHHCNNFYWFGRYLFECVQYFGETLDD